MSEKPKYHGTQFQMFLEKYLGIAIIEDGRPMYSVKMPKVGPKAPASGSSIHNRKNHE